MIVYNSNRDREKKLFQGGKESEEKIFLKKKNIILFHLIESTQWKVAEIFKNVISWWTF